jgi:hypothetical protein
MLDPTPNVQHPVAPSVRATAVPARQRRRANACMPEWQTVHWKQRVQAEARRRLHKGPRGESVR